MLISVESGEPATNPWLANIAAAGLIGSVTWKIPENSSRPGYRPSATGRKRYVRIDPVGVGTSTDSVSLKIIPFSDVVDGNKLHIAWKLNCTHGTLGTKAGENEVSLRRELYRTEGARA